MEGKGICAICTVDLEDVDSVEFIGLPICSGCFEELSLPDIDPTEPDSLLGRLVEDRGQNILSTVTALLKSRTIEQGWKLLAMAPFIADQVEEPARKSLMESALILMGCSVIRLGREGSSRLSDKEASLFLVAGQFMDLSIMGRIVSDNQLSRTSRIDEMILGEQHDHVLFSMIRELDHENDPEKISTVIRTMELLRS